MSFRVNEIRVNEVRVNVFRVNDFRIPFQANIPPAYQSMTGQPQLLLPGTNQGLQYYPNVYTPQNPMAPYEPLPTVHYNPYAGYQQPRETFTMDNHLKQR